VLDVAVCMSSKQDAQTFDTLLLILYQVVAVPGWLSVLDTARNARAGAIYLFVPLLILQ
jgi:hypothetical protein